MRISFGKGAKDNAPRERELTFEQFADLVQRMPKHHGTLSAGEYAVAGKAGRNRDKEGAAWFIPAVFSRPERRADAVSALTGFALDFDDGAIGRSEIETRLAPYNFVAWTTYSHTAGHPKWRAFIPYAQPITPKDHKAIYAHFNAIFEGHLDPRCATTSQLWYLPGHPHDAPGADFIAVVDAPFFVLPDVDRHSALARSGAPSGGPVGILASGAAIGSALTSRPPTSLQDVAAALSCLDPAEYADYTRWLDIAMAIFDGTQGSPDGYDMFVAWSRTCPGYVEGTHAEKWQSFGRRDGRTRISVATLFGEAQKGGRSPGFNNFLGKSPGNLPAPVPAVQQPEPPQDLQHSQQNCQGAAQPVLVTAPVPMPSKWRNHPQEFAIQRKETSPDGNGEAWATRVRETRLVNIEMLEAIGGGPFGTCNLHFECADKARIVRLELALVSGSRDADLKSELFNSGIIVGKEDSKNLQELIVEWLQKIKKLHRVKKSLSHLGWLEDNGEPIGFACGTSAYYADGTEEADIQIAASAGMLAPFYKPVGDIAPWRAITEFLIGQNRTELLAVLATSFASPLVKFSGVSGVVVSIISTASGVGKSSALMASQSVWGDPKSTVHAASDTPLSLSKKMGFTRNLPAYWDDIKGEKTLEQFSELLFQITQGKEKSRLDQSSNLRPIETWDCLAVVAANDSITEVAKRYSNGSDAGVSRIFEMRLDTRPTAVQSATFFDGCRANYGHAGAIYAKWLAANRALAERGVIRTTERLSAELGMQAEERFWIATIACLVTGAAFAKHLKLVDFDVKSLETFLKKRFLELRGGKAAIQHEQSAAPLIGDLIYDHQQTTLRIDALPIKNKTKVVIMRMPTGKEVDIVITQQGPILRVRKARFNTWCHAHHHSPDTLKKKLETLGALVERNTDPMAGAPLYSEGSRTSCYDIDLKKLDLHGDVDGHTV